MNGIILYQSKYGATKKYAEWISGETGFSCIETKKAKIGEIQKYDTIILGGGVYASGIAGLSFLKKNFNSLKEKKIIIFCVGASPYDESALKEVAKHNLEGELSAIPCFYCRGAWNKSAMNVIDRGLCNLLSKAVAKKDPSEYELWEKALVEAGDGECDWTDKKNIEPILRELHM